MGFFNELTPLQMMGLGVFLLLLATQLVVAVLNKLEKQRFGTVFLGTLVTPLCTGYPNLMIGLFGQERLQGDLVLQLNIGNNLANTSLITGLVLFVAGPLLTRPGAGKSKKAKKANLDQALALFFLWLGGAACFFAARDGAVSRLDGLGLAGVYFLYQVIAYRRQGKAAPSKRMSMPTVFWLFLLLAGAAWLIQLSVGLMGQSMEELGHLFPGAHLAMFLGLLTVIPESFLLLRLALQKGSLGFSGLVGDCLVSVPLVVGLSAMFVPFQTPAVQHLTDSAARPYLHLVVTMTAFTILSFARKPVRKPIGLIFMGIYAIIWWLSR